MLQSDQTSCAFWRTTVFMARRRGIYTRCHSACCWSNVASSTAYMRHPLLWCQQHVVHRKGQSLFGCWTVYLSSSPTARHLSPSRNVASQDLFIQLEL